MINEGSPKPQNRNKSDLENITEALVDDVSLGSDQDFRADHTEHISPEGVEVMPPGEPGDDRQKDQEDPDLHSGDVVDGLGSVVISGVEIADDEVVYEDDKDPGDYENSPDQSIEDELDAEEDDSENDLDNKSDDVPTPPPEPVEEPEMTLEDLLALEPKSVLESILAAEDDSLLLEALKNADETKLEEFKMEDSQEIAKEVASLKPEEVKTLISRLDFVIPLLNGNHNLFVQNLIRKDSNFAPNGLYRFNNLNNQTAHLLKEQKLLHTIVENVERFSGLDSKIARYLRINNFGHIVWDNRDQFKSLISATYLPYALKAKRERNKIRKGKLKQKKSELKEGLNRKITSKLQAGEKPSKGYKKELKKDLSRHYKHYKKELKQEEKDTRSKKKELKRQRKIKKDQLEFDLKGKKEALKAEKEIRLSNLKRDIKAKIQSGEKVTRRWKRDKKKQIKIDIQQKIRDLEEEYKLYKENRGL